MMLKNKKFDETYRLMVDGAFNEIFTSTKTFRREVHISVKKLRKYCRENDIDFEEFLNYAQTRKAEENEQRH